MNLKESTKKLSQAKLQPQTDATFCNKSKVGYKGVAFFPFFWKCLGRERLSNRLSVHSKKGQKINDKKKAM